MKSFAAERTESGRIHTKEATRCTDSSWNLPAGPGLLVCGEYISACAAVCVRCNPQRCWALECRDRNCCATPSTTASPRGCSRLLHRVFSHPLCSQEDHRPLRSSLPRHPDTTFCGSSKRGSDLICSYRFPCSPRHRSCVHQLQSLNTLHV